MIDPDVLKRVATAALDARYPVSVMLHPYGLRIEGRRPLGHRTFTSSKLVPWSDLTDPAAAESFLIKCVVYVDDELRSAVR